MLHTPLPDISSQCLSRQFVLDLPNIEITSLDITSHGCYILAGCSNGMVVLYDMTSNDENGTLVGQIRAKGMHTNLLVTVKFSPDNRFGFAGVMKGSMEMLAVDVGQIPVWHDSALVGGKPVPKIIGRKTKGIVSIDQLGLRSMSKAAPLVCTYSHLDPKLRGFGAVTRLRCEEEKYLLICGRGIKNVHVWLFAPSAQVDVPPKWTCLYDVTTNGVSIEALGFRERLISSVPPGGDSPSSTYKLEMVSKSSGMGIRVWDLSHFDEESNLSSNKIPYEDIPTSNDCRAFSENGEMAFGGTYDFSTLKIDTPKDSLRETFEVPSPCLEDDNGQRRRRHMRQIQEVLTTQDGQHALAICTDGGVLYYHHTYFHEIDTDGSLVELQSLIREIEIGPQFMTDGAWALKRVGRRGAVVLVRSCRNIAKTKGEDHDEDTYRGSMVELSLLSDLVPDDVPDTTVPLKLAASPQTVSSPTLLPESLPWTRWNCYFHDPSPSADWDNQMNNYSSSPGCLSPTHSSPFDDTMSETSERSVSVTLPPTRGRPPSGKNKPPLKPPQPPSHLPAAIPLAQLPEVSTPCSERSFSSRSEHATPSSRSSSPLFSTPSSSSSKAKGRDVDPSLLTPTLSLHGTSLHHITQISPLCFPDSSSSPSSSPEGHRKQPPSNRGLLSLSSGLSAMPLPLTLLQDDVDGEATEIISRPPQPKREVSASASSTSETPKKSAESSKKKRPLQSTAPSGLAMAAADVEPPLKKKELTRVPLGPTPQILRTVPSDAVLPQLSPPPHPLLSQFLRLKASLLQTLPQASLPSLPEQYSGLLLEQLRLRSLFFSDLLRDLQVVFEAACHSADLSTLRGSCQATLQRGVARYRSVVEEVMRRQRMEVRILGYRRALLEQAPQQPDEEQPWSFLFSQMFTSLPNEILSLVASLAIAPPQATTPCHSSATAVLV